MDTFDVFLPTTDDFSESLIDVDSFLPTLTDDNEELERLLNLDDFNINENDYNLDFGIDDSLFNYDQISMSVVSSSSTTSDFLVDKDSHHIVDVINFDHNYALPMEEENYNASLSPNFSSSTDLTKFQRLSESIQVDTCLNELTTDCQDKRNTSGLPFYIKSCIKKDEDQNLESFTCKDHESTIKELAKIHVKAELPDFKPIVLTDEEKSLLLAEGITLQTDLPLTKSEEKILKKVRRKIRNKISAKVSRQRKKHYVEDLESQISETTGINQTLTKRVVDLEEQNASLKEQLKRLMSYVRNSNHKSTQATSCLLVLLLSIGLFITPSISPCKESNFKVPIHHERKILGFGEDISKQAYIPGWIHLLVNMHNVFEHQTTILNTYINISPERLKPKNSSEIKQWEISKNETKVVVESDNSKSTSKINTSLLINDESRVVLSLLALNDSILMK